MIEELESISALSKKIAADCKNILKTLDEMQTAQNERTDTMTLALDRLLEALNKL